MAETKSLVWEGEALTEKMRAAQIAGINQVMQWAVLHAQRNHEWQNRSGDLQRDINIVDFATEIPTGVRGVWGVAELAYARIQELGGTIVPRNGEALHFKLPNGEFVTVKSVTLPARPYLRPAGDATYPGLPGAIRKAYDRQGSAGGQDG